MEYDNEWIQENNIKFTQELDINKNGVLDLEEVYNLAAPNNKYVTLLYIKLSSYFSLL